MSVRIRVDLGNVEDFRAKMMRLSEAIRMRVHEVLQETATNIKREAFLTAPVRTGFLRSTIYGKISPYAPFGMSERRWLLSVGAWAPYSRYLEYGTRYIKPRFFLTRAIQRYAYQFVLTIHEALKLAIEGS